MFCHVSVAVNLAFTSRCFKGCVTFRRFKLQVTLNAVPLNCVSFCALRESRRGTTRIDARSARFTEGAILAHENDYPGRNPSISWSGFHGLATALRSFATTPRQKGLMFSFTQISLSVWIWVCEFYNSVVNYLTSQSTVNFDCIRDVFCQISLALWSIEHEYQLAEFYNPGTTHVQHIYPLVRHKQVDWGLRSRH